MNRRFRCSSGLATLMVLVAGCAASRPTAAPSPAPHRSTAAARSTQCPASVQLSAGRPSRVGRGVGPLALNGSTVYAARPASGTVTRLIGGRRTVVSVGGAPVSLAVGFGKLWIAQRDAGAVIGLRLGSLTPVAEGPLPVPVSVTTGAGGVWALSLDAASVWQLSTQTGAVGTPIDSPVSAPAHMVRVGDELWLLGAANGGVSPVSMRLYRATGVGFDLPGRSLAGLSAYGSVLWIGEPGRHALVRVQAPGGTAKELPAPSGMAPVATAAGPCGVWVADAAGRLALIDSQTGKLRARPVRVRRSIAALAASGTGVWVSDPVDGTVVQVSARSAG